MGGRREDIFLFVITILRLVSGDMGKEFKVVGRSRGDGGAGDDIGGEVRDVEEREVLDIVKGGPDEFWR